MGLLNKILKKDQEDAENPAAEKDVDVKIASDNKDSKPQTTGASKKVSVKKDPKKVIDENAYRIISFPMITEKATDLAGLNKYVFSVPVNVNKNEVAKAVKSIYGVEPVKVNMVKKSGKKVRYGRRFGKTKDFKKAIVTLRAEDRIEVYEGV